VAFQVRRNLRLSGLYAVIPIGCQFPWVTLACEDGLDDVLPGHATDVG
jgi:hypothetical protein